MPRKTALFFIVILTLSFFQRARAQSLPGSAYIAGFVGHPQSYSLSCEARSAVDWMAYWGVYISEGDFLAALPRSDDPDAGFVGDPNGYWGGIPPQSYGVHADPVAKLIRDYGLDARAVHGASWDDLRNEIAAGRPVIVWIIGQMWGAKAIQYTASDGHTTTVASFEHTMVMIGYDPSTVIVVDAFSSQIFYFTKSAFINSWGVLGNMAVFGQNSNPPAEASSPSDSGQTYTVQRGDYLTLLAARFGTTWDELARLNNLYPPYTIYAGQTLKIPGRPATPAPAQAEPTPTQTEPAPTQAEPAPSPTPEPTPAGLRNSYRLWLPQIYYNPVPAFVPKISEADLILIYNFLYGSDFIRLVNTNRSPLPPLLPWTQPQPGP